MRLCMPSSRFQVYKGTSMDFCFKCGLLQKRLKPMTFPQPGLPPCGCLGRTQGRCAWCFQGGPGAVLWNPHRREQDQSWTQCFILPGGCLTRSPSYKSHRLVILPLVWRSCSTAQKHTSNLMVDCPLSWQAEALTVPGFKSKGILVY